MASDELVDISTLLPVFKQLDGYKHVGGWHVAFCPAHDDRQKQSLGLSEKGVLKCYRGCTFSQVMRALRDRFPELRGERPVPRRTTDAYREFRRWTYVTPEGEVVAHHVRLHHVREVDERGKPLKKFRWETPDGRIAHGDIIPLDQMPLLLDPAMQEKPDARVFLVEGEMACDALRARQELAVCTGGGSNTIPRPEVLEPLRGREVIIWRDNDGAGYQWAERMRNSLRYIARDIRVVVAPGNPKDDAVDYFAGGGDLDALLAGREPVTECIALDHWRVHVPTEMGEAIYDFDEIHTTGRGELWAETSVWLTLPGTEPEPHWQRLNLLSPSSRDAMRQSLERQFGKEFNWQLNTTKAVNRAVAAYRNADRLESFEHNPERLPMQFLIETLVPKGQQSILHGPPAVGKSFIVAAITLAVSRGSDFCGLACEYSPVLIVDWENDREMDHEPRMERLMEGMGLDPAELNRLPIKFWDGKGIPLVEQADAIRRARLSMGAELVIVDSLGPAAGGEMFSPEATMRLFAALKRIGGTALIIGQVPAADEERLYGNQYYLYMPHGRIWVVKRTSAIEGQDEVDVSLVCKKASNGQWPKPIPIHMSFTGTNGPITLSPGKQREEPAGLASRIYDYLESVYPESRSKGQIALELGVEIGTVSRLVEKQRGVLWSFDAEAWKATGTDAWVWKKE